MVERQLPKIRPARPVAFSLSADSAVSGLNLRHQGTEAAEHRLQQHGDPWHFPKSYWT
jgi:hypothetical protein